MKCVAIDDEPIALSIIREYCRRYGDIDLCAFTSPVEGMDKIREIRPDVVFLDIEMNSHNGIDLARQLPENTCIIFTTAYSQYALDGFNVNAVDFLHKPIFYPRFEQAMQKVQRYLYHADAPISLDNILALKVEHQNVIVKLADICYMEAMDNYIKIFRKNLPTIVTQMTMKDMETRLPKDRFIRLHRSYIVPVSDIEKYSNRHIYLRNSSQAIPVGRKYAETYKTIADLLSKHGS